MQEPVPVDVSNRRVDVQILILIHRKLLKSLNKSIPAPSLPSLLNLVATWPLPEIATLVAGATMFTMYTSSTLTIALQ